MSLKTFQDLIDRCGVFLPNWPEELWVPAVELIGRSAKARAMLAHNASAGLADESARSAPDGLVDRILARAFDADPPNRSCTLPPPDRKPR